MYFKISVTCFCYYFNWIIFILVFCWIWEYIADHVWPVFVFWSILLLAALNLARKLTMGCFKTLWSLHWIRLNYATTHHHPPPTTTSQNISTTTHHHPPPAKIYSPPPTTSQNISTNAHHDPPTAKTFFMRNPFIRISSHCLAAT